MFKCVIYFLILFFKLISWAGWMPKVHSIERNRVLFSEQIRSLRETLSYFESDFKGCSYDCYQLWNKFVYSCTNYTENKWLYVWNEFRKFCNKDICNSNKFNSSDKSICADGLDKSRRNFCVLKINLFQCTYSENSENSYENY